MGYIANVKEVGPRYDCMLDSPTHGRRGLYIKPGTYRREQQLIKRQDVVAALSQAIADRDLNFWTRITQSDWSRGGGQDGTFDDTSRFARCGGGLDVHQLGEVALVPKPQVRSSFADGAFAHRGGVVVPPSAGVAAAVFFPSQRGKYQVCADPAANPPTFAEFLTTGTALVFDIKTDGVSAFFALSDAGVWKTAASAPGNLAQHDTGATGPYSMLVYDALRKNLYGITVPSAGARLEKINAGAAPTVIYDFVSGELTALEVYQGNVIVGWNSGNALRGSIGVSRIYKYDGTNVTALAEMPDATQTIALKTHMGALIITALSADIYGDPLYGFSGATLDMFTIVGSLGPTKIGSSNRLHFTQAATNFTTLASGQALAAIGDAVLFGATAWLGRYNQVLGGGLTNSFGANTVVVSAANKTMWITGLAVAGQRVFGFANFIDQGTSAITHGGAVQLSDNAEEASESGVTTLVSSRMDLALPYVEKFWYGIEVVLPEALVNGQQVEMSYSLDDGATFVACSNSPLTTAGTKRFTFLVQKVNAHLRYAVRLVPVAGGAGPKINAVSLRFAPSNPNAKMWRFTVAGLNWIRSRGHKVEDQYGKDTLDYIFNVSQQSETVTFYEPDEPAHTPRSVWVISATQESVNAGAGKGRPNEGEGEIELLLWQAA